MEPVELTADYSKLEKLAKTYLWTSQFSRSDKFPLDKTQLFLSYEDAERYAHGVVVGSKNDMTDWDERHRALSAYPGQIIGVRVSETNPVYQDRIHIPVYGRFQALEMMGTYEAYIINGDGTLSRIGSDEIPFATSTKFGIVKLGSDDVQSVGFTGPTEEPGRTFPIQVNSEGQMVVNVPMGVPSEGKISLKRDNVNVLSFNENENNNVELNFVGGTGITLTGSTSEIIIETNQAVNDGKLSVLCGATSVVEFGANQNNNSSLTFQAGEGITLTGSTSEIKISATKSVAGMFITGLHSQHITPNYPTNDSGGRIPHHCDVGNYTRLVAARSNNIGKISFIFEIIGREMVGNNYYAKYYFDGRYNSSNSYEYVLYCLEYSGSKKIVIENGQRVEKVYFHPINSMYFTHEYINSSINGSNIINIYRKCLDYSSDDIFLVNVLAENYKGSVSRDEIFNSNADTGYSVQFWPYGGDTNFQKFEGATSIYQYDNNIGASDLENIGLEIKQAEIAPYNLYSLIQGATGATSSEGNSSSSGT